MADRLGHLLDLPDIPPLGFDPLTETAARAGEPLAVAAAGLPLGRERLGDGIQFAPQGVALVA